MARLIMNIVWKLRGAAGTRTSNPRVFGAATPGRMIQVASGRGGGEGEGEERKSERGKMATKEKAKEAMQDAWDSVNSDKPQHSPHTVKQNADRVHRSMNTKN